MRKLLLTLFIISYSFSSCSSDTSIGNDIQDKKLLVKNTLIEFNKSAIKTGKYDKLMNTLKSADKMSDEELENLFMDFFGGLSDKFTSFYNQLEALGFTDEEFQQFASEYNYIFDEYHQKEIAACCGSIENGSISGIAGSILFVACGCKGPDDTNNQGQGQGNNRD